MVVLQVLLDRLICRLSVQTTIFKPGNKAS
jgi:hypothetical protein